LANAIPIESKLYKRFSEPYTSHITVILLDVPDKK